MALKKCPKCELNYIKDGETLCSVCAQKGKSAIYIEDEDLCPNCGENKIAPGEEYCSACLAELRKLAKDTTAKDDSERSTLHSEAAAEDINAMDDVELESGDNPPFDVEEELEADAAQDGEESYDVLVMNEADEDEDESFES